MLHTVGDIAKMLNMHPRTIRRYIENGQLRAERIGGSWRIPDDALGELLDGPETKESLSKHIYKNTEDMLDLYMNGKHRLQKNNLAVMSVIVFNPQELPWVLAKTSELIASLENGEDKKFDFTMTGNEQGLHRIMLIAPPVVVQSFIAELERHRELATL